MTLEDYERSGFGAYEKLAATVSTILATALRKHPEIRLQQLQHRSKAPTSLRKKLVDRGIVDPPDLAETVKDLAGCRTIFYTNADARAFEQSGIIQENFEIDWARVEQLVSELDSRIDSMGPVNLDAIQEYDELEQRHAFLEKQNTDLTNSKEELLGVIQKINNTTKTLFAETFEKIRGNFQEMFMELFGGGKATLESDGRTFEAVAGERLTDRLGKAA